MLLLCLRWRKYPFVVEGYDDDVDGSRVKDNTEAFGCAVRSGWLCNYDSAGTGS